MQTVVGIFTERSMAERAAASLLEAGIPHDRVSVLAPGDSEAEIARVPTTDAEQPGIGRALGAVVGGAAGAAGGMQLGALASLAIPGIGPVVALGVLGAALFGVGGAAVGGALDHSLREGLPHDELYVYEDALRRGRSLTIALAEDAAQASAARAIMIRSGAESLDAAREQWWIGLRDAEAEAYERGGRPFAGDEARYRQGFEAALSTECRGRAYDDVRDALERRYAAACRDQAFRRGYERAQRWETMPRRDRPAAPGDRAA